jgi:hypothetical protein
MKRVSVIFIFTLVVKFSFGQTNSIIGAWYWSDSTKAISFFFKNDGSCFTHSGPKGGAILSKNTKKGKYSYNGNLLTVKWDNSEVETNALRFIDANTIQITLRRKDKAKQRKQVLIFHRVVDEEATFEK